MQNNTVPDWVASRILAFFNQVRSVADITNGPIKDDPADGPDRTIGSSVAARILRERQNLPGQRFANLQQIDDVRGVGPTAMRNLVYSFGQPAAEAFLEGMYERGVIYRANWTLEHFTTVVEDRAAFEELVGSPAAFRKWVLDAVAHIAEAREVDKAGRVAMADALKNAYIDTYHNTVPAPGYALALWFYMFAFDNWFSWERIQQETIGYFDYHANNPVWDVELRMLKGFRQQGIIPGGISAPDLPVVVSWPERSITLWMSELYD